MISYSMFENYRITRRQFIASLIVAFILHSVLITAIHYMPRPVVQDIPVKSLNIKLGTGLSGEEEMLLEQANVPESNTEQVESSLESVLTPDASNALSIDQISPKKTVKKTEIKKEVIAEAAPTPSIPAVAHQFIRERVVRQLAMPEVKGDALGNQEAAAQTKVQAYTQTISLWMDKFKVYPAEARAAGMEGRALLRIRIDRRGNIRYSILSERTAYPLIDQAVLDMARRANPVPPVPDDYPVKSEYLEFIIPVVFKLGQ